MVFTVPLAIECCSSLHAEMPKVGEMAEGLGHCMVERMSRMIWSRRVALQHELGASNGKVAQNPCPNWLLQAATRVGTLHMLARFPLRKPIQGDRQQNFETGANKVGLPKLAKDRTKGV